MGVLTAVDLAEIQRYIYGSNRLRDAVGASELVHRAASRKPGEAILKAAESRQRAILAAAGGNALLEFNGMEDAKRFAAKYSKWLIDSAPGLEAVIVHHEEEPLTPASLQTLLKKLEKAKGSRKPGTALLGLGVTASCRETGLPASWLDPAEGERRPLSAGIQARREVVKNLRERWGVPDDMEIPKELDDLGRTHGEISVVGVVHLDGNGVGAKLKRWSEKQFPGWSEFAERYEKNSMALEELGQRAMHGIMARVTKAIEEKRLPFALGYDKKTKAQFFPVRPILLGGDDLTFVCDGRLALDLAETGLKAFEESEAGELGVIRGSAGVAIVKSHAPFRRAYGLAEALCRNAKRMLREENLLDRAPALDWHVGLTLPSEGIEELRSRQYQCDGNRLTCRPYVLEESGPGVAWTWKWLQGTLLGKGARGLRGKYWGEARSKAKRLEELAWEGPEAIGAALQAWQVVEPRLQLPEGLESGFRGPTTPLVDAVELLNVYVSLEGEE